MSDEPEVEEFTRLGAQLPPVPPDEVPGMLVLRDLTADEQARYEANAQLIRTIAPVTPYTRGAEAVSALGDVVDALEAEPSARARRRLAKALRAAAHALLQAAAGEVAHADRGLDKDEARFELPLPEDDLVALPLDGDAGSRTAEAIVLAWVAHGIDALQRPTNLVCAASGRAVTFFSNGAPRAYATKLALLAALTSEPQADRASATRPPRRSARRPRGGRPARGAFASPRRCRRPCPEPHRGGRRPPRRGRGDRPRHDSPLPPRE